MSAIPTCITSEDHTVGVSNQDSNVTASNFPTAFLRRIGPSDEYRIIPLNNNEVSIGRAKENSYVITDLVVSRKHVIFRLSKDQWTVESLGMNGVALNQMNLAKNQPVAIHHMDTIEFGGSKFTYAFRLQSSEGSEEPVAKKMRFPLSDRNYPSLKDSPEVFQNWIRSKKSLEKTLAEENNSLDIKLQQQKRLKNNLIIEQEKLAKQFEQAKAELELKFIKEKKEFEEKVVQGIIEKSQLQQEKEILEKRISATLEEFQIQNANKTKEFEESIQRINLEKQAIIEQKEFIVEQVTREKNILQAKIEEESRLREEMVIELAKVKESHNQELRELRQRMEEEAKSNQLRGNESESQISKMQEELASKEKEIAEMQSRYTIGLEMYKAIQSLQQEECRDNAGNVVILLDEGKTSCVHPSSTLKLEHKEEPTLNEQINHAHLDFVARMESTLENEFQCGICSELIVLATSLDCMHTFCQYCINQWKSNKVPIECPICRTPITTERRNFIVDSAIDAIVASLSEEMKNGRKNLIEQRLALAKKPASARAESSNTVGRQAQPLERSRGRPRRGTGRPDVTSHGIRGVIANPSSIVHAPAPPRVSHRVAVSQGSIRQSRPIVPAATLSNHSALPFAGPTSTAFIDGDDVIVLSESEETTDDPSVLEVAEISSVTNQRPWRRTLPCLTCGHRKRVTSACGFCGN